MKMKSFEKFPSFSGLHPSIYEFPYFLLSVFENYCFSIIYNFIIARNYRLSIIFTTQYSNRFFRNYVIFPTFLIFLTLKNLLSATTYKRMAPKKDYPDSSLSPDNLFFYDSLCCFIFSLTPLSSSSAKTDSKVTIPQTLLPLHFH